MAEHRRSRGGSRAEIARTRGVIARGEKRRNAEKHRAVGTTRKFCAPTLMQIHSWQFFPSSLTHLAAARSEVARRNWSRAPRERARALLPARWMRTRLNETGIAPGFFCFSSPVPICVFPRILFICARTRCIAYHGSGTCSFILSTIRMSDDTAVSSEVEILCSCLRIPRKKLSLVEIKEVLVWSAKIFAHFWDLFFFF